MILLDTDHFSVLRYSDDPRCADLTSRLLTCGDPRVATTVVTLEEQLRGWLAEIHRCRKAHSLIPLYDRLASLVEFFRRWEVVHFDDQTQRAVPVLEGDTPDTLAARVFEAECEAYPEAIRVFADGRLEFDGGRLRIV